MKLTAQEIYDKLINEEQIKTVKGQIRFHLGDVSIIVKKKDVVGNIVNLNVAETNDSPKSITISSNVSKQSAEIGDVVTVSYSSYSFSKISNGSFVISYDKNNFELVEFKTNAVLFTK